MKILLEIDLTSPQCEALVKNTLHTWAFKKGGEYILLFYTINNKRCAALINKATERIKQSNEVLKQCNERLERLFKK